MIAADRDIRVVIPAALAAAGPMLPSLGGGLRVAGRLQEPRGVRRFVWLVLAGWLGAGCFYLDPINQQPAIAIKTPSDPSVARGEAFSVEGLYADPDGGAGRLEWSAYACAARGCDGQPFAHAVADVAPGAAAQLTGTVPVFAGVGCPARPPTQDPGCVPVTAVRVVLTATDDRGARPALSQEVQLEAHDAAPTVVLRAARTRGYVVGQVVELRATYADADDGADATARLWSISGPAVTLSAPRTETSADDPAHVTEVRTFLAAEVATWTVAVTARDPAGSETSSTISVVVADDLPPCLAQWRPAVTAELGTLPVSAPTVFEVPLALDELEGFPADPAEPGAVASFQWRLRGPGDPGFTPIANATGSRYVLDPAAWRAGDIVELRVDALDHAHPAAVCADDLTTCPISPRAGLACGAAPTQRQTWRVEIR